MLEHQQPRQRPGRLFRKLFVSGFVVGTFALYAIHERLNGDLADAGAALPTPRAVAAQTVPILPSATPIVPTQPLIVSAPTLAATMTSPPATRLPTATIAPTARPTAQPTLAPTVTPQVEGPPASARFHDGTYTGVIADAWYGPLQVEAIVQGGRLQNVQFLDFPQDRRTSQRINRFATPQLVEEAIQAQSAEVDIVSGATLTSEAFMESLQSALEQAVS